MRRSYLLALAALALARAAEPSSPQQPARTNHLCADRRPPTGTGSERRRRRQAQLAELAVNRLHILESLDGQLRQWADRPAGLANSCALELAGHFRRAEAPSCLARPELRRQVPAYMLNLHRRLAGGAGAVQSLMPYKSQVVRSFGQPTKAKELSLMVELNALELPAAPDAPAGRRSSRLPARRRRQAAAGRAGEAPLECRRHQLCYWFHLGARLRRQISGPQARERLVEAELHAFKLAPERGQLDATNGTWANLYQLKTNLLEVSVYQVLGPRGSAPENRTLRLLDIRRIDLHSSGWETFYVKRAVEDWIREPRLNMGLVIKAKSMFDEPIKLGWIRFADLRDAQEPVKASDFELAHQPILVVYTTAAASPKSKSAAR